MALWLLAVGASRHYGWELAPEELRGLASKGLGAAAALFLLGAVASLARSWPVSAVCAWWAIEELQTVLCTALYAADPWPIQPGQAMCSALAGLDLGAFGIFAVAMLLLHLTRKP